MTTTIFNIIQSELIKRGYNEFVDNEGNLVFFDLDHQFMKKIFSYDQDVAEIVDELFSGLSLQDSDFDNHFKQGFLYRFINRKINRQTVESFRMEMLATFLSNEDYINRLYTDMEHYLLQKQESEQENKETNKSTSKQTNKQTSKQTNKQSSDGTTSTDNRSAFADLPQNNIQIDVNSTVMDSASNNEISRNKQTNRQDTDNETNDQTDGQTDGETDGVSEGMSTSKNKTYQLDELFKTNGLLEKVYNVFDVKCFMQVW